MSKWLQEWRLRVQPLWLDRRVSKLVRIGHYFEVTRGRQKMPPFSFPNSPPQPVALHHTNDHHQHHEPIGNSHPTRQQSTIP
jgi:hypothetical protein